ncbi:MAG: DUF4230 domain-containing protein [Planctomycetes bacterium]|nr:DUF4230 domain-containing protein [Planctomycetota bacterium]MBA3710577.1 DUF4230 domain-containing protein [Planctomycetota bacterium]
MVALRGLVRHTAGIAASTAALVIGFAIPWCWRGSSPSDPVLLSQQCQSFLRDIATTKVVMKMVVVGGFVDEGVIRWTSSKDEVVSSNMIDVDFGIPIDRLTPDRFSRVGRQIQIRVPAPKVIDPGYRITDSKIVDKRSDRWLTEPRYESARLAAQQQSLAEAPARLKALGIDQDVRECTRRLLERLVPDLLGDPDLTIEVLFDDEAPAGGRT